MVFSQTCHQKLPLAKIVQITMDQILLYLSQCRRMPALCYDCKSLNGLFAVLFKYATFHFFVIQSCCCVTSTSTSPSPSNCIPHTNQCSSRVWCNNCCMSIYSQSLLYDLSPCFIFCWYRFSVPTSVPPNWTRPPGFPQVY